MRVETKNILTRFLYIIPLTIFIVGLISNWKNLDFYSSFGIKYKYIFAVPIIIFLYQSIRNSKLGWILVVLLYLTFLITWIINLVDCYNLIGLKYSIAEYLSWYIFVLVYLGLGSIYYKFRPKSDEYKKKKTIRDESGTKEI